MTTGVIDQFGNNFAICRVQHRHVAAIGLDTIAHVGRGSATAPRRCNHAHTQSSNWRSP
jgi:hypothetical protein